MTREEAINKLEHLINSPVGREEIDETCYEVMKYLSAQKPRVMTLEELHGWEETPLRQRNPIFIEFKGTGLTAWRTYFDAVRRVSMGSVRCWTSRPTDEQMEAVPWE